ncbi:hypothetical protein C2S53_017158 [Perilla frutescens var. hirtella]|uniref:Uncharacterized protein n=1 Tax=Perilla frutescens var. hirtella TaxID=608512 RepID=A0AAD4P5N2_PERFH|nr:hypothetical protein C2S53_017158 [Perilla frutescens var. hirtella]
MVNEHELSPYAMNAGDGPLSYVKNSSYQGGVLDVAKPILEEEIAKKLEISSNQNAFCIADFGCSTGNNSFQATEIIIEAIKRKLELSNLKIPEFHVFFNDVITNDFNTLFSSLPPNRSYNVAAVPGDFHRRLLPPSSVHFAYSSWSLHWLSEVPKAVEDSDSPAWNGGDIFYRGERKEVCDAYLDQFGRDVESFLKCRAVEMAGGGLMALLLPGVPAFWNPENEFTLVSVAELLRSSLIDMAKKGRLSEAKIDTFNIPYYFPTPQQLKAILERSNNFAIERVEILTNTGKHVNIPNIRAAIASYRAVHESMLAHHFGVEIIDELFDLYEKKLAASPVLTNIDNDKTIMILAVLKRTID